MYVAIRKDKISYTLLTRWLAENNHFLAAPKQIYTRHTTVKQSLFVNFFSMFFMFLICWPCR